MLQGRVQIVCIAVGDVPDDYVLRLRSMLSRHMPLPFDLSCVTDRPRGLSPCIRTFNPTDWPPPRAGMRATTYKLSLFDKDRLPFEEFLYLDTTLVVQRDLTPLLDYAFGRDEELVVLKDWNYDAYNTCVMRIRPGGTLQRIPRAYEAGAPYDLRNRGDQDFATGVIREHSWEGHVATIPEGMIVAYRDARRMAKENLKAARAALDQALIVKFYAEPKMDQLLDPRYRIDQIRRKMNPWHRNAWFWVRETREHWR